MMTPSDPIVKEAQPIELIETNPLEGLGEDVSAQPQQEPVAATEEQVEVIVAPPTTPEPVAIDPKRKDYSHVEEEITDPRAKKRFAQLTFLRENEKRRADQAIAQRDEAIRLAQRLANRSISQANESHSVAKYAVTIGQEKVKNDLAAAHRELVEAQANGDSTRIADATMKMAKAQAEAMQVENVNLPEAPVQPQEVLEYQQLEQRFQQEQALAAQQPQFSAEALENFRIWRERNPWYQPPIDPATGAVRPRTKESLYAERVSSILELEGKAFGTAEHFAELDSRLPFNRPQQSTVPQQPPAVQQTQIRHSPAVAPVGVSRSSAGRKSYTLTPEQAFIAKSFGMTNEEYAKEFYGNH